MNDHKPRCVQPLLTELQVGVGPACWRGMEKVQHAFILILMTLNNNNLPSS